MSLSPVLANKLPICKLSANDINDEFLPKYVHINRVQFYCFFGKKILQITDFWVRNAKIIFLKKNVSTVQLLSN